jgi:hypothetical protein
MVARGLRQSGCFWVFERVDWWGTKEEVEEVRSHHLFWTGEESRRGLASKQECGYQCYWRIDKIGYQNKDRHELVGKVDCEE